MHYCFSLFLTIFFSFSGYASEAQQKFQNDEMLKKRFIDVLYKIEKNFPASGLVSFWEIKGRIRKIENEKTISASFLIEAIELLKELSKASEQNFKMLLQEYLDTFTTIIKQKEIWIKTLGEDYKSNVRTIAQNIGAECTELLHAFAHKGAWGADFLQKSNTPWIQELHQQLTQEEQKYEMPKEAVDTEIEIENTDTPTATDAATDTLPTEPPIFVTDDTFLQEQQHLEIDTSSSKINNQEAIETGGKQLNEENEKPNNKDDSLKMQPLSDTDQISTQMQNNSQESQDEHNSAFVKPYDPTHKVTQPDFQLPQSSEEKNASEPSWMTRMFSAFSHMMWSFIHELAELFPPLV